MGLNTAFRQALYLLVLVFTLPSTSVAQFTEVSEQSGLLHVFKHFGLMGGGVVVADFNTDGFDDVYLNGGQSGDKLFLNNGNATFTDVSGAAGLGVFDSVYSFGACAGDIDNDGDQDLFITTWGPASAPFDIKLPNILLLNNGDGTFSDISAQAGIVQAANSTSASFGDINRDGYLDIYVANYVDSMIFLYDTAGTIIGYDPESSLNFLYVNNGDNTFIETASQTGSSNFGCGLAASFSDFDNDRDPDIIVANDFGEWTNNGNALLENLYPADTFENISQTSGMNAEMYGMGIATGDYDNDGDLDYYITNIGKNILHRNNGDGTFTDVTDLANVGNEWVITDSLRTTGWGANFLDYDADGDLDLYVSNGWVNALIPPTAELDFNKLYENQGNGQFADVSLSMGIDSTFSHRGSALIDFDNDGDMDLISVANHFKWPVNSVDTARVRLYRNDNANSSSWLEVKLKGQCSNRDGIGARLIAEGGSRSFIREMDGGSSHASRNTLTIHFGLDTIAELDTLWVLWPSGYRQFSTNIAVNQIIEIEEDSTTCIITDVYDTLCLGDTLTIGTNSVITSGIYSELVLVDLLTGYLRMHNIHFNGSNPLFIDTTLLSGDLYNGIQFFSDTVITQIFTTSDGCDSTIQSTITIDEINTLPDRRTSTFQIYPNPFIDWMLIHSTAKNPGFSVSIKNLLGKEVYYSETNDKSMRIGDLSDMFHQGVYVVEIMDVHGYSHRQILVKS